jgi:F-type H+-transporting ATPase subunit delta
MASTSTHGFFARRYAGVLFDVVEPRGSSAKAAADLETLGDAVDSSAELREVFENPAIAISKKQAIVEAIAAQVGAGDEVRRTLGLLAERGQLAAIPALAAAFGDRLNQARRIVVADVVTAAPLTDERRAALAKALGRAADCDVTISERVDPSIIGGVVARVGSLVFDGSVQRQVERLRERLVSAGAGGQ